MESPAPCLRSRGDLKGVAKSGECQWLLGIGSQMEFRSAQRLPFLLDACSLRFCHMLWEVLWGGCVCCKIGLKLLSYLVPIFITSSPHRGQLTQTT